MVVKVEKLPIEPVQLGEGPHWDVESQSLYFVNIPDGEIHRYVPATKKHTKAVVGKYVSIIIPVEGKKDTFLVSADKQLSIIKWDGESDKVSIIQKITQLDNEEKNKINNFNDGKCDPSGRLWIANSKVIFTLKKHDIPGIPDGMTLDSDGNLGIAIFNGQRVIKIDPRKPETLLQTIEIPPKQVTSVAFGGQNFDELYVTSGRFVMGGVLVEGPQQGCIYKITGTGAKGLPAVNFKYNL